MKKGLIFFFLSSILYAQNPDGQNASLHITPLWRWGNADYVRSTFLWYPPTQASEAQVVKTDDYGILKHPYAFGISASIKIPTTSFLTFDLAYSFNQDFERYGYENERKPYFGQFWSVNGNMHTISFTMSVYNLFSLYLE